MHEWLEQARDRIAEETGDARSTYELGQEEIDELLDLARIAAHESGERVNAPLVCYLVGLARGRRATALDDLVDAVIGKPRPA